MIAAGSMLTEAKQQDTADNLSEPRSSFSLPTELKDVGSKEKASMNDFY
jgi:hypothetical protein